MRSGYRFLLLAGCLVALVACPQYRGVSAPAAQAVDRAVAVMRPVGNSRVAGTVYFTQRGNTVEVTGTITGLTPGQHGFHVHEYGDLSDPRRATSVGSHYNPTNMPHGAPESARRHVGDLGNITADRQGRAVIRKTDSVIRLTGAHSILGRAVVVHGGEDRFTQPTGDAGTPVAFGVIGIRQEQK